MSYKGTDLELLREVFKDIREWVQVGVVTKLGLNADGTMVRVQVNLLPENREIVALMGMADIYDVTLPEVNDMVVVAFAEGHPDEAYVVGRLNSSEEPVPQFARTGHSVKYPRPGKKLYLGSNTKVGIGRQDIEPTEPMVLGNVLLSALTDLINAFLQASQVCQTPLGPGFLDPGVRAALNTALSKYVTTASTNVVSTIAFTERGS